MKKSYLIILIVVVLVGAVFVYTQKNGSSKNVVADLIDTVTEPPDEAKPPHPVSLPVYAAKEYDGRDLKLGQVLARTASYTRYYITYRSGELTISGIMNLPHGKGPWPVLILNHGYIDPDIYTNGRGLKREQDYLGSRGYAVLHPDYRNHAQSDKDENIDLNFRLGYVEDVINAVYAVKNSELSYFDKEKIGLLGHSMGGGVTLNILVIKPDLVKAAVLFAPVSADYRDNFERWLKRRPEVAEKIIAAYGTPTTTPEFWDNISAVNFLDNIKTPILLHHGTADESVPIVWSKKLVALLQDKGKDVVYYEYQGEPHEFARAWPQVIQRTREFFDDKLK